MAKQVRVDVGQYVGDDTTPSEDGRKIAQVVVDRGGGDSELLLDMSSAPPEDVVSKFVNSFFHYIAGRGIDIWALRHRISWKSKFDSEKETLEELTDLYFESEAEKSERSGDQTAAAASE
jgi:hypothetical protein